MMYLKVYPFLILIFAKISVAVDRRDKCITPNGDEGICLPGLSCKVIADAVSTNNKSAIIFAKKSQCGYDTEPLFCCGASGFPKEPYPEEPPSLVGVECGVLYASPVIVGGNVTELDEFPWLAALEFKNRYTGEYSGVKCDGSLINPLYVITAAHCLVHIEFEVTNVRLGDWDLSTDPDCKTFITSKECGEPVLIIKVEKTFPHPLYVGRRHYNDIGLIRLESYVTFTQYIRPICLNFENSPNFELLDDYATVAGWGVTETGFQSNLKLKVEVPIISNQQCRYLMSTRIMYNQELCAGGEQGKDACIGDSGGPLMRIYQNNARKYAPLQWFLDAVVAWGIGCGQKNVPGIYTRTSPYMNWITDIIQAK